MRRIAPIVLFLFGAALCAPRLIAQEWSLSTNTGLSYPVVVAAGGTDVVLAGTVNLSSGGMIYRFNGSGWVWQTSVYPAHDGELTNLHVLDSSHAWATGHTIPEGQIFFYDGSTWARQTEISSAVWIYDVYAASASRAWAVGADIFVTADGGATWVWQTLMGSAQLTVHGTDANHVWAGGYYYGGPGYIAFCDGSSWTVQTTLDWEAGFPLIADICALGTADVWSCGNVNGTDGCILHFDGSSWSVSTGPFSTAANSISVRGANDVWAGLGNGNVLRFDGATWVVQGDLSGGIKSIDATLPDQVWAGSGNGRIYRHGPVSHPPWIHDYDGDGTSDIAVFRPSSGMWSIRDLTRAYLGNSADDLVPADYDGDGTTDIAVFRDSTGMWSVLNLTRFYLGTANDRPVPGDYDGDGTAAAGIFRGSSGLWSIRDLTRVYLGAMGDTVVPGWYDDDVGKDIAVFRGSSGMWSVRNITRFYFGASGDALVPGDYSGAGRWEAGIFRETTGMWSIRNVTRMYLGSSNDWALPADYDGDGIDDAGIFRASAGMWSVRNWTRAYFGAMGDIPVTR